MMGLKFFLLIMGLISKILINFHIKIGKKCTESYDEDFGALEEKLYWTCLTAFSTAFFLHSILEIDKLLFFCKNHYNEFVMQVFVFLSVFYLFDMKNYTNQVFDTIFILALLMNLLEVLCTRNAQRNIVQCISQLQYPVSGYLFSKFENFHVIFSSFQNENPKTGGKKTSELYCANFLKSMKME